MTDIVAIPALVGTYDNYIWLIVQGNRCCVVDPGDARPVLDYVQANGLTVSDILITHYHGDHIGGVKKLRHAFPECQVIAPEHPRIRKATEVNTCVEAGMTFHVLNMHVEVLDVSGHTLDHIAYVMLSRDQLNEAQQAKAPLQPDVPWLFCGDALFSAGCGRLFEGTPEQMHRALMRIANLADETLVYCAHEYTLSNLAFAAHVEPDNIDITQYTLHVSALRADNVPSLPSTIGKEKQINPFLRCANPSIIRAVNTKFDTQCQSPHETLGLLRQWKDHF